MSLIKQDTLPIVDEVDVLSTTKNQLSVSHRPPFKNSIQMLVANSGTKKSVVFPINELEKPTIDSVLNTVPLFYNPITKQLLLQQDLEQQESRFKSINSISNSVFNSNINSTSKSTFNSIPIKKCETRFTNQLTNKTSQSIDKKNPFLNDALNDKVRIKKLNNLNNELTNQQSNKTNLLTNHSDEFKKCTDLKDNCSKNNLKINLDLDSNLIKEERKFLETQLDDFTTKSINLSQWPIEIKLIQSSDQTNEIKDNFKDLNLEKLNLNDGEKIDSANKPKESLRTKLNNNLEENKIEHQNCNLNNLQNNNFNSQTSNQLTTTHSAHQQTTTQTAKTQTTKKDTYKTHRRTPSYIHDFHNVIKNNNQNHQSKSHSSITVSSAAKAISSLCATSLANATSTLSNTINTTSKLNDNHHLNQPNQMHSITNNMNTGTSTTTSSNQHSSQISNDFLSSSNKTSKQIVFNESKNRLNFYDLDTDSERGSLFVNSTSSGKNYSSNDDNIEPLNLPLPYLDKSKKLSLLTSPFQSVLSKLIYKQSATVKDSADNQNLNSRRNSKSLDNDHLYATTKTTTALIFENRPSNLPTKSPNEEQNHRIQYEQMIKDAKLKELKDAKQIKKNFLKKKKDEERIASSIKIWQNEIIPNFDKLRNSKKTRELWFNGIPPFLRGTVWSLAIKNQLNLDDQSFDFYLSKWYDNLQDQQDLNLKPKNDDRLVNCLSKCSDESIYELIKLDVSRTFPQLKLFQKNSLLHDKLLSLLGTYVISYRPDIGYIQGMSFIMGMFLINMDSKLAFNSFANLLECSPILIGFMKVDQKAMEAFYSTFDVYFNLNLPELFSHFKLQKLNTELFMIDWVYTLYTKVLPLDISTRLWDLMFRDGEEVIVKAALTLLKLFEKQLLCNDFINCAQFLTQLSTQSNDFPVNSGKFFSTLNGFTLKPVTINRTSNKLKCKNFYSLFEHFNNQSNNINL